LLGLAPRATVAQQLDLFFQVDDEDLVSLVRFLLAIKRLKQQLLELDRIISKAIG